MESSNLDNQVTGLRIKLRVLRGLISYWVIIGVTSTLYVFYFTVRLSAKGDLSAFAISLFFITTMLILLSAYHLSNRLVTLLLILHGIDLDKPAETETSDNRQ